MLAPCYRSYSPEGSVRNCTRIEQYTQKGNIEVHSCNKFAAEKQKNITYCVCVCVCVRACVCVCVCSFSYPACKAHALYSIVICGPYGSTKFFHILLKKGTIFEKKKLPNIICVLVLSTTFVRNICHSKKNLVRYRVGQK